jgi:hypothetical protein
MLKCARHLVEERLERKGRKSLHFPKIKFRKWLFTSTEEPANVRSGNQETFQSEQPQSPELTLVNNDPCKRRLHRGYRKETKSKVYYYWMKSRQTLGRVLDWFAHSETFIYAFKFMLGVMLCAWPAFVPAWTQWYYLNRGGLCTPLVSRLNFSHSFCSLGADDFCACV